jgi:hypothetical protein
VDIDELRLEQRKFEGDRQENRTKNKKLESTRIRFIELFPEEKIMGLVLNDYVSGKQNKYSFCNYLETGLKGLGDIHGYTSFKFGIYFGVEKKDKTPRYRFKPSIGANKIEAFEKIKNEISKLLAYARTENIQAVKKIALMNMFKGKILSTYYPEIFLNIFSSEHLNYFFNELGIPYSDSCDEIDKRNFLMSFKNDDDVMRDWKTNEFTQFLYARFGRPPKDTVPEKLKKYSPIDLPPLSKVKANFVNLEISDLPEKGETTEKNKKRKIDFEKGYKVNKKIGDRGEEIVVLKEKEWLESKGKKSLADRVKHVAKEDDTAGYDVLSFEVDGNEKYIEVKSTQREAEYASFLISSSEYKKSQKNQSYYIYLVFEADTQTPKIFFLKQPFLLPESKIKVTAVSYRVELNLNKSALNRY